MSQFLHFTFSSPNLLATFILCFCVLYWLIVMLGAIDMDFIDFDIEMEADTDVDMTGGTEAGVAWMNKVLYFFNLGRVPFMVWLSIIGLIAWFCTTTVNFLLGFDSFVIGSLVFLGSIVAALVIAKPLTYPLVKVFDALEKSDALKSVIGQMGEVLYPNKGKSPGEAEIVHEGSHIKIFILPSGEEIKLERGQKVLVISKSDTGSKTYIVEPYN